MAGFLFGSGSRKRRTSDHVLRPGFAISSAFDQETFQYPFNISLLLHSSEDASSEDSLVLRGK